MIEPIVMAIVAVPLVAAGLYCVGIVGTLMYWTVKDWLSGD